MRQYSLDVGVVATEKEKAAYRILRSIVVLWRTYKRSSLFITNTTKIKVFQSDEASIWYVIGSTNVQRQS